VEKIWTWVKEKVQSHTSVLKVSSIADSPIPGLLHQLRDRLKVCFNSSEKWQIFTASFAFYN